MVKRHTPPRFTLSSWGVIEKPSGTYQCEGCSCVNQASNTSSRGALINRLMTISLSGATSTSVAAEAADALAGTG
jgi:hypothetical protein